MHLLHSLKAGLTLARWKRRFRGRDCSRIRREGCQAPDAASLKDLFWALRDRSIPSCRIEVRRRERIALVFAVIEQAEA